MPLIPGSAAKSAADGPDKEPSIANQAVFAVNGLENRPSIALQVNNGRCQPFLVNHIHLNDRCTRNRHSVRFFWTPPLVFGPNGVFGATGVQFFCASGRFFGHLSGGGRRPRLPGNGSVGGDGFRAGFWAVFVGF